MNPSSFNIKYINNTTLKISNRCLVTGQCMNRKFNDLDLVQKFYNYIISNEKDEYFVLDIGTDTGVYCFIPAIDKRFKFTAFEPNPNAYDILKENLKLNDINIDFKNQGVWEKNTTLTLKVPTENKYSGVSTVADNPTRFKMSQIKNFLTHEVECVTIDSLDISKIDAIKIDAEGAEKFIFKGATELLTKYSPMLLFEYDNKGTNQFNYDRSEILDMLKEIGYTNFEMHGQSDMFAWR